MKRAPLRFSAVTGTQIHSWEPNRDIRESRISSTLSEARSKQFAKKCRGLQRGHFIAIAGRNDHERTARLLKGEAIVPLHNTQKMRPMNPRQQGHRIRLVPLALEQNAQCLQHIVLVVRNQDPAHPLNDEPRFSPPVNQRPWARL
jgi:hypothetical protein